MDEKDLQIFLTLAETGNLTRTAEKLKEAGYSYLQYSGAAFDAGRDVRLLETLMQSRDHPATLGEEHSMYLKGCILQVL